MADSLQGAEITKLSFLQMLTDKVNKMDCDGSLYSRLVEARTKVMENAVVEIKDLIKDMSVKMDIFHTRFEENLGKVKEETLRAASDVKTEALGEAKKLAVEMAKKDGRDDKWKLTIMFFVILAIAISCIALGMRIEDILLRMIGVIK